MEELLTFKRFHTAEQAAEIITLLHEHHIPAQYEEEVILLDKVYVGQNFDQRHLVKIAAADFSRADALLKSLISVDPEDVEPDYYLLSFTTEELKEVITKKDEWGDFDYALALKLLEKRGITYSPEQLEQTGNGRIQTLSQPQEIPVAGVLIGFLAPLIVFIPFPYSPVFSFLGIFMGGFIWWTKKTLPDGSRVLAFAEKTRQKGKWMMISGVVLVAICWALAIRMARGY
ncbi:MAG: hypothetical protein J7623_22625 [Chitinophaga sp.]|uniref:hypothetical protein n=1 Tax=Chitinophaga sp. TaxID=1869181 RepID=UPI001B085CEC|nr:hypothetical protein [Chitinophaga sp.]MBO9731453.1 hypothetical protein [Chitinophaga sp.]